MSRHNKGLNGIYYAPNLCKRAKNEYNCSAIKVFQL